MAIRIFHKAWVKLLRDLLKNPVCEWSALELVKAERESEDSGSLPSTRHYTKLSLSHHGCALCPGANLISCQYISMGLSKVKQKFLHSLVECLLCARFCFRLHWYWDSANKKRSLLILNILERRLINTTIIWVGEGKILDGGWKGVVLHSIF